ncbi:MAG: hypothetical protein KJ018_20855 [Burkholderiales bacterium]|nr:hypothetical protein [Burkholderiales bacterium]
MTYEVGIPLGCTRMVKILAWLYSEADVDYKVFDEYLDATRHLSIGQDRLLWIRSALREQDVELEAINRAYRDRVFDTCWEIIDRFGSSIDAH